MHELFNLITYLGAIIVLQQS